MAGAYFICGLIPALFIRDRLYDPQKQINLYHLLIKTSQIDWFLMNKFKIRQLFSEHFLYIHNGNHCE